MPVEGEKFRRVHFRGIITLHRQMTSCVRFSTECSGYWHWQLATLQIKLNLTGDDPANVFREHPGEVNRLFSLVFTDHS